MEKPTILLMSDDLRHTTGVATMSRELVYGTAHKYNWVQIAAAREHAENGKVIDLSESVRKSTGVSDANVTLYPSSGYGNDDLLYTVMAREKPNAILHFTDPRYWRWLYMLEREIRKKIPLTYLNIWDDLPYPMWNKPFYESCDSLFSISKQTYNINKWVLGPENCTTLEGDFDSNGNVDPKTKSKNKHLLHYVPHGINDTVFKPLPANTKELVEGKKRFFGGKSFDFVLFFNSRNSQRKHVSDLLWSYRLFCDSLPKEKSEKCCLILHTEIVGLHGHGTDLMAVKEAVCRDYNVFFSQKKITPPEMNLMYNLSDVTVSISSNEGFGLSISESIMAGTPVIANVTGGLQDQIGQTDDDGKPVEFTREFATNNIGKYRKHGVWSKPVWPRTQNIHGSVPTPYLFDDMVDVKDVAEAMMYWYLIPSETREKFGSEGRRWALNEGGLNAKNMCDQFINGMDYTLSAFTPQPSFSLHTSDEYTNHVQPNNSLGVEFPKVNIYKTQEEVNKVTNI